MVGDTWCVHHGRDVSAYPTFSPRRNWYEGVVREVTDTDIVVRWLDDATTPFSSRRGRTESIQISNRRLAADERMSLAR